MGLELRLGTRFAAGLKLARLLEAPEAEFAVDLKTLEASPVFQLLVKAGAVALTGAYRLGRRTFEGRAPRAESGGIAEALQGDGELVALMHRVGLEQFQEVFLKSDAPEAERAALCGITPAEARRLAEFVDRVYIQEEFAQTGAAEPVETLSPVAGIAVEGGRPALAFFNREIWKGRYEVVSEKLAALGLPADQTDPVVRQLGHLERRKSSLYAVLEALIDYQADYLRTGDLARRRPLTQRALAARLGIEASALNRLISGKAIQLPWGLEAPIKALLPSAKTLLRDRLHGLILAHPDLSDEGLRKLLRAAVSRRSIAQYRLELGLARR